MAMASDQHLWVHGRGNIPILQLVHGIWTHGILKKMLYIPKLWTNLFSIGQATNRGIFTTSKWNRCEHIDQEGEGQLVIIGTRNDKLYKLEIKATKPNSSISLTNSMILNSMEILSNHVVDNIELWHKWFHRINSQIVLNIVFVVKGFSQTNKIPRNCFVKGAYTINNIVQLILHMTSKQDMKLPMNSSM